MKHLIKRMILVIACTAISGISYSQTTPIRLVDFNIKSMLPSSPNAAALGKFGDIPVGYYTGTANISVPLYTIKADGLEIPLVLRYHSSGIKVEEQASDVGLGWNLEPGGAIIQVVNGNADFISDDLASQITENGYDVLRDHPAMHSATTFFQRNTTGTKVCPCIGSYPFNDVDTRQVRESLERGSGQPDIYQYNFPGGYSGKFYINPDNGNIVLIDKTSPITFTLGSAQSYWTAKTLDGTLYTFAAVEYSVTTGSLDDDPYTGRTWRLTSIVLPNRKKIRYVYTSGTHSWAYYNETFNTPYPWLLTATAIPTKYGNVASGNTMILDSIVTPDVVVKFNVGTRHDVPTGKRVNSIDIKDRVNGTRIKSFNLGYTYFGYNTVGGDYAQSPVIPSWGYQDSTDVLGKRLKLLSVQEVGHTGDTIPAYRFQYDESALMPMKTSFARDYWGFYNGKDNNGLLPKLDDANLSYLGYAPAIVNAMDTLGFDRSVDTTKMGLYMLKKIIYPTGGYSEFDYQVHRFGPPYYGAGMRVKAIRDYSAVGTLARNKRINYNGSGILMSPLALTYMKNDMYVEWVDGWDLHTDYVDIWFIGSQSYIPFSSGAAGGIVGYSEVTEEELSVPNSLPNGKTIYYYHNENSDTQVNMPDIPDLMNGKAEKEEIYNAANNLLRQTKYAYVTKSSGVYTGVKIDRNIFHNRACDIQDPGPPIVYYPYPHYPDNSYVLKFYPIQSKWIVLDTMETRNYDGATVISKKEKYTYNSLGQVIASATHDSRAIAQLTEYLYPIDSVQTGTPKMLVDSGYYTSLLEKRIIVNGNERYKMRIGYRIEDSQVVKSGISQSFNAGTHSLQVGFNDYGPHRSILQFTEKGLITALIWDNTYMQPVAAVRNAAVPDVAYTSFEGYDKGGWTYTGSTTGGYKHSGNSSYPGGSGVSKSGLTYGTTYILGYWTTNGSAYSISGTTSSTEVSSTGGWKYFEHIITGVTSLSISGSGYIDDLKLFPQGAQMTSFTYTPLTGLSSQSDAKGQQVSYDYDEQSRLKHMKDQDGNILKSYDYHYGQ